MKLITRVRTYSTLPVSAALTRMTRGASPGGYSRLAMIVAMVVLPKPGGPESMRWRRSAKEGNMAGGRMDASSKALLHHWRWAAEKGLMNTNTAGGIRAACAQVIGVLDEQEQADVTQLDVEAVLKRFENLKAKDFKP